MNKEIIKELNLYCRPCKGDKKYSDCQRDRVIETIKEIMTKTINKSFRELVIWIAEYSYRKANPDGKRDCPSVVYEQVEKDFDKFLNKKIK